MNPVLNLLHGRQLCATTKTGLSFANFFCAAILLFLLATIPAQAANTVIAWGANDLGQSTVPAVVSNITAVAGGTAHSLAIKSPTTVIGWGDNSHGETAARSNLVNAVAIAAGSGFSLALQSNGVVVGWGSQSTVPAGLTNVAAISASLSNVMALTRDGNVVSWGIVPAAPANVTNVVAIAAGNSHSLALKGDGTVVAWGDGTLGKTNVPVGLTNVVALSAGQYHSIALKSDGTLVAWGDNTWGQGSVPSGLSNVVAISAGAFHNLALKRDGTVAVWGDNTFLQTNVPTGLSNIVGIAAGRYHNLVILGNGLPVITVQPVSQYDPASGNASFSVLAEGLAPLNYQWQRDGTNIAGATNSLFALSSLATTDAGVYSVTVSNSVGTVKSVNVVLPPVWRRPFFLLQPLTQTALCNDSPTLQVTADGTKPLSFQWWYAGAVIPGATNPALPLSHVTVSQSGSYFVVVTNFNGSTTSKVAVLTVNAQPPLITSSTTASGKQGAAFSYTITGLQTPNLFGATGLPNGLAVNPSNGLIQGTPQVSGTFTATLFTGNLCSSAQTNLTLTIASSVPIITSAASASGTEASAFTYRILATDSPTWFGATNLPQGLAVDPATGFISGNPVYAGTYDSTIMASNIWGSGSANLHLSISNALVSGLAIADVTTNYSAPYLLDISFSLRNNTNPITGGAVVTDPRLFSVTAFEDGVAVSTNETSVFIQSTRSKVLKAFLALDFTASVGSLANGDANNNGVSDAVDAEVGAAQTFVDQQPVDAQIGVFEFHRDDQPPQQVQTLTTDKTLLDNSIAGIWTNYVMNFPSGSRAWDAVGMAISALGTNNVDEQHAVVFCSDGYDTSSTNTVNNIITAALKANVQIYCVGFGDQIDTATLQSITSQTLGHYYTATNLNDLAIKFAQIGKDLNGRYILRWATLKRSSTPFAPTFQLTYQGITASSPPNPPPVVTGTNIVYTTNNNTGVITTNNVLVFTTNYIISPFLPTAYAGNVTVGSLRLATDSTVRPNGFTLRTSYVPRYIRQINVHYQANWPCITSLQQTNAGQLLYGWSLTETNDGVGGKWAMLKSPNTQSLATSIPFASFGPLLTFTFRDPITPSTAFSAFDVDNTIYTNTGNQSFTLANTLAFITVYPVLPFGTPVPWLIQYGFTPDFAVAETNDPDGDGIPTWEEYLAGTNPTNAASFFAVQSLVPTGTPGNYQITFSTGLNRNYRVETSTNLLTWQPLQSGIAGTGGNVTITDNRTLPPATQTFYRVAAY
jgi:alpha-tubulin suppressor-like RCC1 family protein